jgi:hypothetical protein
MSDFASETPTLFPAANRWAPLSCYDFKRLPQSQNVGESGMLDALAQTERRNVGEESTISCTARKRILGDDIHAKERCSGFH